MINVPHRVRRSGGADRRASGSSLIPPLDGFFHNIHVLDMTGYSRIWEIWRDMERCGHLQEAGFAVAWGAVKEVHSLVWEVVPTPYTCCHIIQQQTAIHAAGRLTGTVAGMIRGKRTLIVTVVEVV